MHPICRPGSSAPRAPVEIGSLRCSAPDHHLGTWPPDASPPFETAHPGDTLPMPNLMVVIASTRPTRVGMAVGRWFVDRATEHPAFDVDLVDLAELDLPFMDEPEHPRFARYVHDHTKRWSARVKEADAFVFVTPEYNHG